jgi:NADPH-dependent 2,4-dienoyl-CoA reductase/sulfur reductase-like enzyme
MAAERRRFVVVGGGVAGISCAEELARLDPTASIVLLSASRSVKGVRVLAGWSCRGDRVRTMSGAPRRARGLLAQVHNYVRISDNLDDFEVIERCARAEPCATLARSATCARRRRAPPPDRWTSCTRRTRTCTPAWPT